MSQLALFPALATDDADRDPLDQAATHLDAADPEQRLAALVATGEIHRDSLTEGQTHAIITAAHHALDELIADQPYRRTGLELLRDPLASHIATTDPLSLRLIEDDILRTSHVDVPDPLRAVLHWLHQHRRVLTVDVDPDAAEVAQ